MFREVDCQFEALRKCHTPKDIRKALKSLPKTLDETYKRILLSIDEEHRFITRRALQWIAYSFDQLTVKQLAEAASIIPEMNETPISHDTGIIRPDRLIDILSSLVIPVIVKDYRGQRTIILLAHFSVQE